MATRSAPSLRLPKWPWITRDGVKAGAQPATSAQPTGVSPRSLLGAPVRRRWSSRLQTGIDAFLEEPDAPRALAILRIATAGFALLQAALWYPDWLSFFGPDGWMQWEISRVLNDGWTLHIAQVHAVLKHLGLAPEQTVSVFYWFYVASILGLLVGWHTRVWAVLACLCHYVIMGSLAAFVYGVDIFLQMALFYLMVMPASRAWSLDARQGRVTRAATWHTGLSLRVLQVHLCLVYLSAGVEKLLSPEWWNGNVIWRSLVQPDFRQLDFTWLARHPWMPISLSWFTMILESGYWAAMWVPRLRVLWLAGIVALHVGIGLFLGLRLFGLIMIVLSVSAFGYAAWRDVKAFRGRRGGAEVDPTLK
jgi:vitamin K-dependent gamma-carboxylase-like protein